MIGCADFETTTNPKDCRVWAWGICEVGKPDTFTYGNDINQFMSFCADKLVNHTLYFHNLKFDGIFILYWLFRNGFTCVKEKKELKNNTFCTLISDMGQFYCIEVCFEKKGHKSNKVKFLDSLKILNFKVSKIAKDFNLPIRKLEIGQYNPKGLRKYNRKTYQKYEVLKKQKYTHKKQNIKMLNLGYNGFRKIGHKLTNVEVAYLRNDVEIMARALQIIFDLKMDKMTIGADALNEYKKLIGEKNFKRWFPVPSKEIDDFIRESYKGGWTYVSDKYKGKTVFSGLVYDVNSLYPSRMHDCLLPYGEPVYYKGKYKNDELYPLYVQHFCCQFKLKENHLPTIQLKHDLSFVSTEYLKDSGDKEVDMYLTNVDLELFFNHYDVFNIEYIDGYKMKGSEDLFKDYIDKWIKIKIESGHNKNGAMKAVAKLMLNSLYGKFGLNPVVKSKVPKYDKRNDLVKFKITDAEERESIYIPIASFVTSYARRKTIESAQAIKDRFIYADTDSLHIEGYEKPTNIDIDSDKLGYWKNELVFRKGKYLRQKSYMELGYDPYDKIPYSKFNKLIEDKQQRNRSNHNFIICNDLKIQGAHDYNIKITCAGMPDKCYKFVRFDNFEIGAEFTGKLQHTNVSGGIVLKPISFSIKK
jgi:hypothetical protein